MKRKNRTKVSPQDGMSIGECQFSHKKQYISKDAAMKAMRHNVQRRTATSIMRAWSHENDPYYKPTIKNECRAYKCPVCKLWHLTSNADPSTIRLTVRELIELHPTSMSVADKWLYTESCGDEAFGDLRKHVVRALADNKVPDELWSNEWLWAIARRLYYTRMRMSQWHDWARMISTAYSKTNDVMSPDYNSKNDYNLITHITTDPDEMTVLYDTPVPIAIIAAWQAMIITIENNAASTDNTVNSNETRTNTVNEQ